MASSCSSLAIGVFCAGVKIILVDVHGTQVAVECVRSLVACVPQHFSLVTGSASRSSLLTCTPVVCVFGFAPSNLVSGATSTEPRWRIMALHDADASGFKLLRTATRKPGSSSSCCTRCSTSTDESTLMFFTHLARPSYGQNTTTTLFLHAYLAKSCRARAPPRTCPSAPASRLTSLRFWPLTTFAGLSLRLCMLFSMLLAMMLLFFLLPCVFP